MKSQSNESEEFSSSRNRGKNKKPPSDAALANERQRINVPYEAKAWDHLSFLSEEDREILGGFHLYCLRENMTAHEVAEVLGYDKTNASRILRGTYSTESPAVWERIMVTIRALDSSNLPIVHIGGIEKEPEFVETRASKTYWQALDFASRGGFAIMAGESGSGKNKTTATWARNNPGRLITVTHPPFGGGSALMKEIAQVLGVAHRHYSGAALFPTIRKKLSSRQILWIDEAGRAIPRGRAQSAHGLEALRDFSDQVGCGVILSTTWRDIEEMSDIAYQIEQVTGRAEIFRAELPTLEQVASIADQFGNFGTKTHAALLDLSHNPGGLRTVTKVLNVALRACTDAGVKMSDKAVAGAIQNRFARMGGSDPFFEAATKRRRRR